MTCAALIRGLREQLSGNSIRNYIATLKMLHQYGPGADLPRTAQRPLVRHERPRSGPDLASRGRVHSGDPARAVVSVDPGGLDLRPHLRPRHSARTTALPTTARPRDGHDTGPRHASGPMARRSRQPHPSSRRAHTAHAEVHWSLLALMLGCENSPAQQRFSAEAGLRTCNELPASSTLSPTDTRPRPASSTTSPGRTPRRHTCPLASGAGTPRSRTGTAACFATPATPWSSGYR